MITYANGYMKFIHRGLEFELTLTTNGIEVKETLTGKSRLVKFEFRKLVNAIAQEIINEITTEHDDYEKNKKG
jgi:hypothetical protein